MSPRKESQAPDQPKTASEAQTRGPSDPAATVIAYLLAGPLTFGGIGWALDAWLNTSFFIVVGILGGMGLAFYTIWIRYGKA